MYDEANARMNEQKRQAIHHNQNHTLQPTIQGMRDDGQVVDDKGQDIARNSLDELALVVRMSSSREMR